MDAQRAAIAQLVARHFPSETIGPGQKSFILLQKILDAKLISRQQTWELQALGVIFGDALINFIDGLAWWEVTDQYGTDAVLRYRETTVQLSAVTMISKRIEDGEEVDILHIANWLKNFIEAKKDEYQ